ncbi:MAG: zf-HC2 domain-containing protein [Planctomycetales bacterium]|nr:zf-HC2 domain-containing protein [Planctomycetales bacterium]
MNDPERRDSDEMDIDARLEAYLDGQLDDAERRAFEERLRDDADLAALVEAEAAIKASLLRLHPNAEPSEAQMQDIVASLQGRETTCRRRDTRAARRWPLRVAALAVAAALGGVVISTVFVGGPEPAPFFQIQPLAKLYKEAVAQGFEPYYECHDDERFAATFLRRQRQPLRLLPMPQGTRMLGLSYPGGLSRDTTAVLCRVDDAEVVVFIDRLDRDDPRVAENDDPRLNVFRQERFGLVFYEVTPLDEPRMIYHFAVAAED